MGSELTQAQVDDVTACLLDEIAGRVRSMGGTLAEQRAAGLEALGRGLRGMFRGDFPDGYGEAYDAVGDMVSATTFACFASGLFGPDMPIKALSFRMRASDGSMPVAVVGCDPARVAALALGQAEFAAAGAGDGE